jgi:hypothetical protein
MKRSAAGLAGVVLALALSPLLVGTAQASCAGPQIDVSPKTTVTAGQVTVTGQYFAEDCNDTLVNGQSPAPVAPTTGITITFVQNGRTETVGTVDADAQYRFSMIATVPAWARPGQASIRADETAVPLTITSAEGSGLTQLPVTGLRSELPNVLVAIGLLSLGTGLIWSVRRPATVGRHRL